MVSSPESKRTKFREFPFSEAKLKDLVLYLARRCQDDPTYDSAKLSTMLYYADFAAYRLFGEPISGATYEKYDAGPVPTQLPEVQRQLIDAGEAKMVERRHFLGGLRQLIPASSDAGVGEAFGPEERELLDSIAAFFQGKSARETAQIVQAEPGWALAKQRERIPYESGWLKGTPISPEVEWAALRFAREKLGRAL